MLRLFGGGGGGGGFFAMGGVLGVSSKFPLSELVQALDNCMRYQGNASNSAAELSDTMWAMPSLKHSSLSKVQ